METAIQVVRDANDHMAAKSIAAEVQCQQARRQSTIPVLTVQHAISTLFNTMNYVPASEQVTPGSRAGDASADVSSKLVKSAARTLDILELLGRAGKPLTLTEISVALRLPKSSTYLLLQTLVQRGYLEAPASAGPFQLGLKVIELAGTRAGTTHFLQHFPPVARDVVARCEETVQLAVLDGREVVYLAKQDGTRAVRLVSSVGKRLPAHATALGKALLAGLPDCELRALFSGYSMVQMTPRTIVSFDALMRELSRVRTQQYAVDDEEAVEDLRCYAAPVRDAKDRVVAAISVSVPKSRAADDNGAQYVAVIKDAGRELSRRIGYTPLA
jgi:IclR family transcriptional regulator, KDG regulon repressor